MLFLGGWCEALAQGALRRVVDRTPNLPIERRTLYHWANRVHWWRSRPLFKIISFTNNHFCQTKTNVHRAQFLWAVALTMASTAHEMKAEYVVFCECSSLLSFPEAEHPGPHTARESGTGIFISFVLFGKQTHTKKKTTKKQQQQIR